jgi:protein TonB
MDAYVQDSSWLSKRAIVFVVIVALHILAIYAFATGLAQNGVRYVQTILQTNIIQQEKPKELPPPPPPVELKERPPVQVVAPDINISVPADAPPPPITLTTTNPPPPAQPRPAPIVPGTPITAQFPSTEDYYPPASQRANEEGRAIVHYCVSAQNKVMSVDVKQTSNFERLDQAAIALVRAARSIKAGTSAGRPIDSCRDLGVTFKLRQ